MSFKELFIPRWKNSNPIVRERAVKRLSNQKILKGIAYLDSDWRVRVAAVNKLEMSLKNGVYSNPQLNSIAKNDTDWRVCLAAVKRLSNVKEIIDVIKANKDLRFCNEAIKQIDRNCNFWKTALATKDNVREIENQNTLAEIVKDSFDFNTCLEAINKITRHSLLVSIAHESRYVVECKNAVDNRLNVLRRIRLADWDSAPKPNGKTAKMVDEWLRANEGKKVLLTFLPVIDCMTYKDESYWIIEPPVSLDPLTWELPVSRPLHPNDEELLSISVSDDLGIITEFHLGKKNFSPAFHKVEFTSDTMHYKVGFVEGCNYMSIPSVNKELIRYWQVYRFKITS